MSTQAVVGSSASEANGVNTKHRTLVVVLALMGALLITSVSAQESKSEKPEQTSKATSTAAPTVRTSSGLVRGATEGEVWSFKGIPFAAPPVGEDRWRPPQPLPPWQGVRDASKFGADCAQMGFTPGTRSMAPTSAEDCLFLNIWRPASAAPNAKLPVMVWIYGEGLWVALPPCP